MPLRAGGVWSRPVAGAARGGGSSATITRPAICLAPSSRSWQRTGASRDMLMTGTQTNREFRVATGVSRAQSIVVAEFGAIGGP